MLIQAVLPSSSFPSYFNHVILASDKAIHLSSCRTVVSLHYLTAGVHLDVPFNCLPGSHGQTTTTQRSRLSSCVPLPPRSHRSLLFIYFMWAERSPAACCVSPLAQVVSDDRLVEALPFVQELGDVFWGLLKEVVFQQELDSLKRKRRNQGSLFGFPCWQLWLIWSDLKQKGVPHLLGIHIKFLPAHGDLLVSLGCFTATQNHEGWDLNTPEHRIIF